MKAALSNWFPAVRDRLRPVRDYLGRFWDNLLQLLLACAATVILYTVLIYLASFLWTLYLETHVGQRFVANHPAHVDLIEDLLRHNLLFLILRVIPVVAIVCLVVGAASRTLMLIRYFYDPQGFIGRTVFWGLPCAVLSSFAIHRTLELAWTISFAIGLLPTLALFHYCFTFTSGLLPEISTVFAVLISLIKKGLQRFATAETNEEGEPVDDSVFHYEREKRSERRHKTDFSIIYYGPEGDPIDESIAFEVSNHGFCLWQPKEVVDGDTMKFELRVENSVIPGEAQVKWVINPSSADDSGSLPSKAGCRITSMKEENESVLRNYLERLFEQTSRRKTK
jgi:hypothetical protein